MKWGHHFYTFGLGLIILITGIAVIANVEGFDFNKFITGISTGLSGLAENTGISIEIMIVAILFIGIYFVLKAMGKI